MTTVKFLRKPDVLARRGTSRPVLYRQIAAGIFPRPLKLTPQISVWPEHEVDSVNRAQLAGATPAQLRALVTRLMQQRQADGAELLKGIPNTGT